MRFIAKYKKLIPGIIAILILAVALVCSSLSYAWYSYNKTATVAGYSVEVTTPITVYISDSYSPEVGETKFLYEDIEENGFGYGFEFTPTNVLYPASTSDGETFRYASNVDIDGKAIQSTTDTPTFIDVAEGLAKYFYIEKSFYMMGVYKNDVDVYLSDVVFAAGSANTSIYKAVRVAITCTEDVEGTLTSTTKIIKCSDDGDALPVASNSSVVNTDPAIANSDLTDDDVVFTLPAFSVEDDEIYCHPVLVTIKIWIEGQNDYAVVSYAGTAFTISLDFDVKKKD